MIEINLVPDVKQELIKAQRVRNSVISLSILIGVAAVGIVILLAIWVFAVQAARGILTDNAIKSQSQELSSFEDIGNTVTIQNQLSKLPGMHDAKNIDSRIFDILTTINPAAPNNVSITNLKLDSATKSITIEAQAASGYPALEVFKKTINATTFEYSENGEKQSIPLASQMSDTERSYGDDSSGAAVLRFTITFVYPEELFSRTVENPVIAAPNRSNVTDSFLGVPNSLFGQRANDRQEEN